ERLQLPRRGDTRLRNLRLSVPPIRLGDSGQIDIVAIERAVLRLVHALERGTVRIRAHRGEERTLHVVLLRLVETGAFLAQLAEMEQRARALGVEFAGVREFALRVVEAAFV